MDYKHFGDFNRAVQYGVTSAGLDCQKPNKAPYPDLFTGIPYFMDWILDNIKP